jgi:ABC-type bacteriocin/lantibiotic exporter with double-glycine peptidase domain
MRKAKTSIFEILFIVAMFIPTLLMAVFHVWPLFWVFLAFSIIFGAIELWYARTTDQTVSQHFWDWSKKHKGKAIAVLTAMAVMWGFLIWHLGSKMFH